MNKEKSTYKEGDEYWAFILEGSNGRKTESLVKIKFTDYISGWSHHAKVINDYYDNTNGVVYIDYSIENDPRIDSTKLFKSYKEAKEHLIKYYKLIEEREIDEAKKKLEYHLTNLVVIDSIPKNKKLLRESKIDSLIDTNINNEY